MSHLDEGTIHAWLDGALPPEEAAQVEAHAQECADCAALVAEARGFIAGASRIVSSLDVVRGNVIPASAAAKPASQKSLWKKLQLTPARAAIAATILVGVASTLTLRRQSFGTAAKLADTAISAPAASVSAIRAVEGAPAAAAPAAAAPPPVSPSPSIAPAAPRRELRVAAQQTDSMEQPKASRSDAARDVAAERAKATEAVTASVAPGMSSGAASANNAATAAAPAAADMRVAKPAAAEPRVNALNRGAPAAAGMSPLAQRAAQVASAEGCYSIIQRSLTDPDLHGFPTQFQLAHDSTNRNIVAPIVGGGPLARPVDGANWQLLAGNSTLITVPSAGGSRLQLQFFLGDTVMRVSDGGTPQVVRFTVRSCGR